MKAALYELRLYVAEVLIEWAWRIMPESPERRMLTVMLQAYCTRAADART